jgi:YD repeat-containing protein
VQSQSDSSAELATGTVSNLYDMRGRLVKQMQTVNKASVTETAETFVTQWAYNLADQVTQVTYPDGELLTSSYLNGSGAAQSATAVSTHRTCANLQTGLQYDLALRLKSQTLGNGVVQTFNYYGLECCGGWCWARWRAANAEIHDGNENHLPSEL